MGFFGLGSIIRFVLFTIVFYVIYSNIILNRKYIPSSREISFYDLELYLYKNNSMINRTEIETTKGYLLFEVIKNDDNYLYSYLPGFAPKKEIKEKEYFKIWVPIDKISNYENKIKSVNFGRNMPITYFEESTSIYDLFNIKIALMIMTISFTFKLINFIFGGGSDVSSMMTDGMDVKNVKKKIATRFDDIAGMTESKDEIKKYVDMMKIMINMRTNINKF